MAASESEEEDVPWYRSSRRLGVGALTVLLFGAAMHLGGAGATSVAVWSTVAVAALAMTGFSPQAHRRDPLFIAGIVFAAVTALQLCPLPPSLLSAIDPHIAQWTAFGLAPFQVDQSARWRPLHADPGNGIIDLQYAIGALAAYAAAARVARRGHGEAIVRAAAAVVATVALVGFAHKLGEIEKVFGFYQPTETAPPPLLTPIINQNHLSNYLGIGSVLFVGLAATATSLPLRAGLAVAALLCGAGSALSFSRAGIASTLGAHVMLASWIAWRARPRRKGTTRKKHARAAMVSAATVGIVIMIAAFAAWGPLQNVHTRTDTTKLSFIRVALRVAATHPIIGAGSGSYYAVVVADGREHGVFTAERAECLPIDLAVAIGPVLSLVVCALALGGFWRIRPMRKAPAWVLGATCAVLAALLHNLLDFSLWLGATGFLTAVLAGTLAGESSRHTTTEPFASVWRPWIVVATLLVGLAGVRTARSAHFVDRAAVRALLARDGAVMDALRPAMQRHPADAFLSIMGAQHAVRHNLRNSGRFINQAMILAPRWPAPHELIAWRLASLGYRQQAMLEARLAIQEFTGATSTLPLLFVRLRATREELNTYVPRSRRGDEVLGALVNTPLAEIADAVALERSANNAEALIRVASRLSAQPNGSAQAQRIYESVLREHPSDANAAILLSRLLINAGELDRAEALLVRTQSASNNLELYGNLASIMARRSNTEGMRRVMQQWLERVGGDFDARMRVLGLLGELELGLGNFGAALTAFEQAELTSSGDHPYLARIVEVARQSGDIARWRGACALLREKTSPDDARRRVCDAEPDADAGAP